MNKNELPLKDITIETLCNSVEKVTYEIPIYQRNYAWGKTEISALVQDVYDSSNNPNKKYYIGTLVSFYKGDQIYEVIDGQQRLTTINLIIAALNKKLLDNKLTINNKLTFRARPKSSKTIQSILESKNLDKDEIDLGIVNGFQYAETAISEIVPSEKDKLGDFFDYFIKKVHIIHYQVPKDVNLNHYFEIMNSRGEQLEKHEIVKARLLSYLKSKESQLLFNEIWENCSEMNVYIQQKWGYGNAGIFGKTLDKFETSNFQDLLKLVNKEGQKEESKDEGKDKDDEKKTFTINELISSSVTGKSGTNDKNPRDTFEPIIDFPNFLLIVLKITRILKKETNNVTLDDKDLIAEFDDALDKNKALDDENWVEDYAVNLLKAKFFLDNYIVHHSNEEETEKSNPWKLQVYQRNNDQSYLKALASKTNPQANEEDEDKEGLQSKLVHLLSMFEVSFTSKQRKNYLFYCLLYLFQETDNREEYINLDKDDLNKYCEFLESLAKKYLYDIYLDSNIPPPGSFDDKILLKDDNGIVKPNLSTEKEKNVWTYKEGNSRIPLEGNSRIPLFVFNYMDYKIWKKYATKVQGKKYEKGHKEREEFFKELGCSDFELYPFDHFYFSRTRNSLEHFFPQAKVEQDIEPSVEQINCFGNFAMIGSDANSRGSNWDPIVKCTQYLDSKTKRVSVASLKFWIMMQKCKDNKEGKNPDQKKMEGRDAWTSKDIKEHQSKMLAILLS